MGDEPASLHKSSKLANIENCLSCIGDLWLMLSSNDNQKTGFTTWKWTKQWFYITKWVTVVIITAEKKRYINPQNWQFLCSFNSELLNAVLAFTAKWYFVQNKTTQQHHQVINFFWERCSILTATKNSAYIDFYQTFQSTETKHFFLKCKNRKEQKRTNFASLTR